VHTTTWLLSLTKTSALAGGAWLPAAKVVILQKNPTYQVCCSPK
jgi:hypothetical protein